MIDLRTYIIGFALSLLLTFTAFWLVYQKIVPAYAFHVLIVLALAQLFVQLVFFLHLGREPKQRWNVAAVLFTIFVVAVLVGGTLWIMQHLEHRQSHDVSEIYEGGIVAPHTQHD